MGPLSDLKIIELAGIGPGPFAGMLLADMGAEVISVERSFDDNKEGVPDCNRRGKKSIVLDLKSDAGVAVLLQMVEKADVLFEGFRPGVMERLGIGPDECLQRNPRLIYGRMTGWGQYGPLSKVAGHDINYISLTGALHSMRRSGERPVPPLNLVGDYGGGSMFLIMGILAALYETQRSGKGQVIDAAITDGSATLMAVVNSLTAMGDWTHTPGKNLLDTGAHFYDVYKTKDEKYISIGPLEPQFYQLLIDLAGLDPQVFSDQEDIAKWPSLKKRMVEVFKARTRQEWCDLLEGTDTCFAPVLDYVEAQSHPHNVERETYINLDGFMQPAPAPRFSRTTSEVQFGSRLVGEDTVAVLKDWGVGDDEIMRLNTSKK